MIKFLCNKLVRDNTVKRLEAHSISSEYRTISGDELRLALKNKLIEESAEVEDAKNDQELIAELADVLEVIDGICETYGISKEAVLKKKDEAFAARGGFKKGCFVEVFTMAEGNPRIEYYRSAPKKYPEIK